MNIEVLEQPDEALIAFLDQKIAEFNQENWELAERKPLAIQVRNDQGEVVAGSAARTFGNWLLIKTLWVSAEFRGQNLGSKVLRAIEDAGRKRGCNQCLLDTLNFQAMPFYQQRGYEIEWVQEDYPLTGCKYFMVKQL